MFSLGVILYELLARRRPFPGEGATDILYKIVHEEPAPLPEEELGPGGHALHEAVWRALAKDLDQRWPSAGALGDELARVLGAQRPEGDTPADASETVKQARALVSGDRLEEGLGRLQELTSRHPHLVEARRALRWATREAQRRQAPTTEEEDHFPELDATFQSPATAGAGAATPAPEPTRPELPPTILAMRTALTRLLPIPAAVSGRPVLALGGVALLLALGVGLYFALRGGDEATEGTPSVATTPRPGPRPTASATAVASASPDPQGTPVAREPVGPLGKVTVTSPYAIDVQWRDRVLARGETAAQLSLPAGKQTLTLTAPQYLLRETVTVEVRADEVVQVSAPELGRINVRANPDNCKVFIDGVFIDYPPILDRPLAAGSHAVSFEWPDGGKMREEVVVERGKPAYVTGRRD